MEEFLMAKLRLIGITCIMPEFGRYAPKGLNVI
jgi:hypothetical protein